MLHYQRGITLKTKKLHKVNEEKRKWLLNRAKQLNTHRWASEEWFQHELHLAGIDIYSTNIKLNHCVGDSYIIDVFLDNLAIEVDGSIHNLKRVKKKDAQKDHDLKSLGMKVFRVKHNNYEDLYTAINLIKSKLKDKKVSPYKKPSVEAKTCSICKKCKGHNSIFYKEKLFLVCSNCETAYNKTLQYIK
jgi:very-short-patch-repair endonuclease